MPCCNTATHKRLQCVLCSSCSYTANAAKQRTGLYSGVYCDCTHSTAANSRPTQAAIIPPAPRWSAHTRPDALHRYRILPPRRTLYRSVQTAYYNKVYKGAGARLLWIHARRRSIPQTMPARRLAVWHRVSLAPSTRRSSPAAGARRAARNYWRLAPQLFSGFRPIANKGEQ